MSKIGFIGTGIMGRHMAKHLQDGGHELLFCPHHTPTPAELLAAGGRDCATHRELAEQAEVIITIVPDTPQVAEVLLGDDGVLAGLSQGKLVIDMSSISPIETRDFAAKVMTAGCLYLDAPVSGGQAGAENGVLTVMVGGDAATFERAKPVMDAYSRAVTLMGSAGAGQLTKMVNQICIAGLLQGLSEAINFGMRAGLDMERVIEVISKGAAQSWQMENRAHTMVKGEFEFGFPVVWMRKDLKICIEEADRNGALLPATALIDQFYHEVQHAGGDRWDTSSLIHNLMKG